MQFNFIHQSRFCSEKLPLLLMETSPLWSDLWRGRTAGSHITTRGGGGLTAAFGSFHVKVEHWSCCRCGAASLRKPLMFESGSLLLKPQSDTLSLRRPFHWGKKFSSGVLSQHVTHTLNASWSPLIFKLSMWTTMQTEHLFITEWRPDANVTKSC